MDDFSVGSVPSSDPYGDRHPYGDVTRKRQKHHDEPGSEQDDTEDTFEATSGEEDSPVAASGEVEDYYRPSDPGDEE